MLAKNLFLVYIIFTMKLYLDDVRDIPEGHVGCRTAEEAMHLIDRRAVTFISFDHDLGTELTGYDVACHVEQLVQAQLIKMPKWHIHSANPIGAKRIMQALMSAERYIK